jgi:PAT family beta-lactamase induction signal transducer AmpG
LAYIGENVFQSLAFTGLFAISFETIGRDNPLAATTFSLLQASAMAPIVYMQVVDGQAYSRGGIAQAYLVDGAIGVAACLMLALLLTYLRRKPLTPVYFPASTP